MNQDIHPRPVLSYRDLQLPERAMREPGNSRPGHFCSSIDVANLFALRRQCHCPGEDVAFLPPPEGVAINDLHRIAIAQAARNVSARSCRGDGVWSFSDGLSRPEGTIRWTLGELSEID